jgi:hypothetical protein
MDIIRKKVAHASVTLKFSHHFVSDVERYFPIEIDYTLIFPPRISLFVVSHICSGDIYLHITGISILLLEKEQNHTS